LGTYKEKARIRVFDSVLDHIKRRHIAVY